MTGQTLETGGSPGSFNDFAEQQQGAEPDRTFTRDELVQMYTQGLAAYKVELEQLAAQEDGLAGAELRAGVEV